MTALVHSYQMIARAGSEDALASALEALAEAVKGIAGSQGAMTVSCTPGDVSDSKANIGSRRLSTSMSPTRGVRRLKEARVCSIER